MSLIPGMRSTVPKAIKSLCKVVASPTFDASATPSTQTYISTRRINSSDRGCRDFSTHWNFMPTQERQSSHKVTRPAKSERAMNHSENIWMVLPKRYDPASGITAATRSVAYVMSRTSPSQTNSDATFEAALKSRFWHFSVL